LIEGADAVVRIDARVFGAIGTAMMVFLVDDPHAIRERRRTDTGRKFAERR
jgi:adenylate kinase